MKKLSKLQINSERIMKNEELMILRGGYGSCLCFCLTVMGEPLGSVFADTGLCGMMCSVIFGPSATGYCTS
jgi:hypothetical protein